MLELNEWLACAGFGAKPWLLLGKGPTFDRRGEFALDDYHTFGLNHVVAAQPVDVAHVIDIDVVGHCASALRDHCRWLVMPRYPNVRSEKSLRPLEDWFADEPVLRELDEAGRLVWYNLAGRPRHGTSPAISTRYFSSEAALKILARAGAHVVRTLGVDGGNTYARAFADVADETLLANGQASFDQQFARLDAIAAEFDIDFGPLIEPFRIFIGSDAGQMVAARVLEYSIRKSASIPVEITPLVNLDIPVPRDPHNKPRTDFAYYRWTIPARCHHRGRALWLDPDMLVFSDIAELAEFDMGGHALLCTQPEPPAQWDRPNTRFHRGRNLGVMLLDCAQLDWDIADIVARIDRGEFDYEGLFHDVCVLDPDTIANTLPPEWNDLERHSPSTKLTHFTVVPNQPWKTDSNPLNDIWMEWYREAVEAGAVPVEEVESAISFKLVKPSLRAALKLAPARRAIVSNAVRDLSGAQVRIAELERELELLRGSTAYRIGNRLVEAARGPRDQLRGLVRRARAGARR